MAPIADTGSSEATVARELDALIKLCGRPASVVNDNGATFTSKAVPKWEIGNRVGSQTTRPYGRSKAKGCRQSFVISWPCQK
jgi:putative transposase